MGGSLKNIATIFKSIYNGIVVNDPLQSEPEVIRIDLSQDVSQTNVSDSPIIIPSTTGLEANTIIVPGAPRDKVQEIKAHTIKTINEYLSAARSMHLPIPKVKLKEIPADTLDIPESPAHSVTPPVIPVDIKPKPVFYPHPQPFKQIQIPKNNPVIPNDRPKVNNAAIDFMRRNTPPENNSGSNLIPPKIIQPKIQIPDNRRSLNRGQIIDEYIQRESGELGRIVTATIEDPVSPAVNLISSLFFGATFIYMSLTLLLFGVIIALAITLSSAGAPGFIYLKYFPKAGLLPVLTCLMTIIFLFVSHKIRDGSRISWLLGILTLLIIPVYSSLALPVMSYPLVKMVSVFADTGVKPILSPSLSVSTLAQFFSVFLAFEIVLILLLAFMKSFNQKSKTVSDTAKTALIVVFIMIFIPITSVAAYGYWQANETDFGLGRAESIVPYRIYYSENPPGKRTNATNFITNEELANTYNAIRVTYDVPLPTLLNTGIKSPINIKQVNIPPDFNLENFASKAERDPGTVAEPVTIVNAVNQTGYITRRNHNSYLWAIFPDNILVNIYSNTANDSELIAMAQSLK